jgi:hypothetical protein
MGQRNGYRSSRGRSAVARKVMFGGPSGTNGIMPNVYVKTTLGQVVRTNYFGGMKKGGAAPSATGYTRSFKTRSDISAPALYPNYLFKFTPYLNRAGGYPGVGGPML